MANYVLNATVTGLQEFDFIAPEAGNYRIKGTIQAPNVVPTAAQGAGGGAGTGTTVGLPVPSQVVAVVRQNSTVKLTSNAGDRGFSTTINSVAAGDTLKVTLSSSLAQDQQPEAIQCTISIFEI